MTKNTTYWSKLPALPWRYRYRTALSQAFTLQVSGSTRGTRHKAALYLLKPEGGMRRIWSRRFTTRDAMQPDVLKAMACSRFLRFARSEPRLKNRLTISHAVETAERVIDELHAKAAERPTA